MVPIHSPETSLGRKAALSSADPWAASESSAAMVTIGPTPNAIDAAFHISVQAALTARGSPWPPHSAGAARPFHPAAAHSR